MLCCVVCVIPVCVYEFPSYVIFVCLYKGCDFRVLTLRSRDHLRFVL